MRPIEHRKGDPYKACPVIETERFTLRLVRMEDAADLLVCYSDVKSQPLFNADSCTSDFCHATLADMEAEVQGWLGAYDVEAFVRFAIVDKETGRAVGTVEMFGMVGQFKTDTGILRLDIASQYERDDCLRELIALSVAEFFDIFGVTYMETKAIPQATERIAVLRALGFAPYDLPEREHYWRLSKG